jgi:hypothetical protein
MEEVLPNRAELRELAKEFSQSSQRMVDVVRPENGALLLEVGEVTLRMES